MKRVGIGLALLVLAGLATTFAFCSGPAPTVPPRVSAPPTAPAPSAVADVTSPAAPPLARHAAAPHAPGEVALRVRVQDRDRRPVVGATIRVTGEDPDLTFPPTGEDGWTRSHRLPLGNVDLLAQGDGRSGSASWRWTPAFVTEITIWANRDRDVEVTVVDPAGAPQAGVDVGLFGDQQTDWRRPSVQAATGEDGVARLHIDGNSWLGAHRGVRAVAIVGGANVVAEPVAWSEAGPTRITIAADRPPARIESVLHVNFVDPNGAPVAVRGPLAWARVVTAGAGSFEGTAVETHVDGTAASVTGLAGGDDLRLYLREQGRLVAELAVTLPPGAREQVVVMVRGGVAPRLEIPLVDPRGQPITSGSFVVTVLLHRGGYERESVLQPDAEGRLLVTLAEARGGTVEIAAPRDAARLHWPAAERLQRPYRTTFGRESPPNPPLAVLEFAPPEPAGTIALGPVTVPDLPPRLHGVVRDGDGRRVAGVRILLSTVTRPEPEAFAEFATRSDAEGRFEILATALPDEVFVAGRMPLGFCAPVRVRPSAEPVTLRLQRTAALALDLRASTPPGVPEALQQRLRPRIDLRIDDDALTDGSWMFFRQHGAGFDTDFRDRWGAMQWLPEDGACRFLDLVPGTYRVLAYVAENRVLDVPGVQVVAGETARPALLQGVEVGGGVEANRVRLQDSDGRPLAGVRVWLHLPEWKAQHPHGKWCDTDANGEAWYLVPRGALVGIDVKAEGHAPVQLRDVALPLDLTLTSGTSFDFVITGLDAVVPEARAIVVGCMPFDGTPPESPVHELGGMRMFGHPQANLDDGGRATIANLPPGRYRLWLGAVPPLRSARGHTFVLLGDRVVAQGDPARITVEHELTAAETAVLLAR